MKKYLRFTLAMLFVCVIFLTVNNTKTFAANATSGKCGTNATWSYDQSTSTLTISGTGAMTDFTYNEMSDKANQPWADLKMSVNHVVIESGITSIGDYSFYGFLMVYDVTIPNTVKTIGAHSFAWIRQFFTSVEIPEGVTTIKEGAFDSCNVLTSVTFPSTLTTIGKEAFADCVKLASLTLPANLKTIGESAFFMCYSVKTVTVPDSVTKVGKYAFDDTSMQVSAPCSLKSSSANWGSVNTSDYDKNFKVTLRHSGTFKKTVVKPTYTAKGYTCEKCSVCQTVRNKTNYTAKLVVKKPTITKVYSDRKGKVYPVGITVKWTKCSYDGYQVQMSRAKDFSWGNESWTVKSAKTLTLTRRNRMQLTKYYVRVRAYKICSGKKVYSAWSSVKSVKTVKYS